MKKLLATSLSDSDGNLTTPFRSLCELTGLNKLGPIDTLEQVHPLLQEHWYQGDIAAGAVVEKHANLILLMEPHLLDMHFLGEVLPPIQHYDVVFVLGALYTAVHKRPAFFARLYDMGIRADLTVFTANMRKRWDGTEGTPNDKESDDVITKPVDGGLPFIPGWQRPDILPKNEGEIVHYVLGQVAHEALSGPREVCITYDAKAGTLRTLETWSQNSPYAQGTKRARALLVGSQPNVLRSQIEGVAALGQHFESIDACGYDLLSRLRGTYTLHELAKLVDTLLKTAS